MHVLRRLLDLLESDAPEQEEAAPRMHDASPPQLGDPPDLAEARPPSGTHDPGAARRDVAQPHAAAPVAPEPPREPEHAADRIPPAHVPMSTEISPDAEKERGGQREAPAPFLSARLLPGRALREHAEQHRLAHVRRGLEEPHADAVLARDALVVDELGASAHSARHAQDQI